jgi:hypothetical protein
MLAWLLVEAMVSARDHDLAAMVAVQTALIGELRAVNAVPAAKVGELERVNAVLGGPGRRAGASRGQGLLQLL